MAWITDMQHVLEYIEENMDGEINFDEMVELTGNSLYHLQRSFSLLTGMTLTEYIRQRKLTLAAVDLRRGMKVIDTAVKYGYDSQDGFARAFARFHGILPSEVHNPTSRLNACSPLHVNLTLKGGIMMEYRMEHKPSIRLLGIRQHFEGVPFGKDRENQEGNLFMSTRAVQWLLRGMSYESSNTDVVAITDINEEDYSFWYCAQPDDWSFDHLYDQSVTGIDFMDRFGLETLEVPEGNYAVFQTPHKKNPVESYMKLREEIATEWLPGSGYTLRDAPELAIYHWYSDPNKEKRTIEIWIPVC